MKNYLNANTKNYNSSIELLKSLAVANPKTNFVFRKHPHEDEKQVKLKFGKLPRNLFLEYKFQVSSWIIASRLYMHPGCTTSFEAACCKKKIICFIPNNNYSRYDIFKTFGNFFSNQKKCFNFVNKFLTDKKNNHKKYSYNNLNSLIFNLKENNFFYKEFINDIKKIKFQYKSKIILTETKDTILSIFFYNIKKVIFGFLSFIKNQIFLKSFLINYLPEKYLYSLEDSIRKFDKLDKKTIKTLLYKFNKIEKRSGSRLFIKEISDSVFHIKNK